MTQAKSHIFLISGEASGDKLGADLMSSLKSQRDGLEFSGVGGELMAEQGLKSLFPMSDLSVMGIAEVVPRLKTILSRIKQTIKAIDTLKPDVVISIDAPDFSFRVMKAVFKMRKNQKNPILIHYVAPSVWAWRPARARKISKFLDHLLCLLPIEPPYFEKYGLDATFIGHPIVHKNNLVEGFREKYSIAQSDKLLCVLPGSRYGEIKKLSPVFAAVIRKLLLKNPDFKIVIPTFPHFVEELKKYFSGLPVFYLTDEGDKKAVFYNADAAIAASGTVGMELAKAGCPHIIAYKINPLTSMLVKKMVKVSYAHLVNILLNKEAVPEFLQEKCTVEFIEPEVSRLLEDQTSSQQADFMKVMDMLGAKEKKTPGDKAAEVVLSYL